MIAGTIRPTKRRDVRRRAATIGNIRMSMMSEVAVTIGNTGKRNKLITVNIIKSIR